VSNGLFINVGGRHSSVFINKFLFESSCDFLISTQNKFFSFGFGLG